MKETPDGRKQRGTVTRRRLIDAALALIAQDGLAGLTSAALARTAGVSKSTVFHHFSSLDQVPLAVLDHILEGLAGAVEHHNTARAYLLQAGLDVLQLTAAGAPEALAMNALLVSAKQNPALHQRMAALSTAYRDQMARDLLRLAPQTPPETAQAVADITSTAVDGLATHLMLTGEQQRLERAWTQLVELLLAQLSGSTDTGGPS